MTRLMLAVVIAGSVGLALVWAHYVPIYEFPDEASHFRYTAAIYAAGGLVRSGDDVTRYSLPPGRSIPDPAYLEQASGVAVITERREVKAPAGYGSPEFFARVNRDYRPLESQADLLSPSLLRYYPFGYYALDAAFVGLVGIFDQKPVDLFFAARTLSALLLAPTLLFTFGIARELGISTRRSLLYTALIGFFPMTTFVAAAVQPDNLSATLVTASLFCAFRLRREPGRTRWTALLGVALGLLAVTKYQYLACTGVAVVGLLVAQRLNGRRPQGGVSRLQETVLLGGPAGVLLLVQAWISWGSRPLVGSGEFGRNSEYLQDLADGPVGLVRLPFKLAAWVVEQYLLPGRAVWTFWGTWLDAPIELGNDLRTTVGVWLLIAGFNLVLAALLVLWLGRTGLRLARMLRRGRWRRALEIAFSHPLVNSYLLFTVFLIAAGGDQGRYWFPYLLGVFLVPLHHSVRILPRRKLRVAASRTVLAGLVAFTVTGSVLALPSFGDRYYGHGRQTAGLAESQMQPVAQAGRFRLEVLMPQSVLATWHPGVHQMAVIGWAVDPTAGRAARSVFVSMDGAAGQEAVVGDDSPDAAGRLGDHRYDRAGFDAIIDTDGLSPGWHEIAVRVVSADGSQIFMPGDPLLVYLPCRLTSATCPKSRHNLPE